MTTIDKIKASLNKESIDLTLYTAKIESERIARLKAFDLALQELVKINKLHK